MKLSKSYIKQFFHCLHYKKMLNSCGKNFSVYGKPTIIAGNNIILGNDIVINEYAVLNATGSQIDIGDHCIISSGAKIIAATLDPVEFLYRKNENHRNGKIKIGNNVWICAGAVILPGVEICDNVIIAAGAVVTKSIKEDFVIWGGGTGKTDKKGI